MACVLPFSLVKRIETVDIPDGSFPTGELTMSWRLLDMASIAYKALAQGEKDNLQ